MQLFSRHALNLSSVTVYFSITYGKVLFFFFSVSLITVTQAQATTESTRKGDFPTQEKPTSGKTISYVTVPLSFFVTLL